jgi:hypothetical protein
MITARINVDKIDKSRFFKGKKGRYLNIVLIETPDSEYGDYLIKQEQTKEERERGEKTEIIGNAKFFKSRNGGANTPHKSSSENDDWT